MRKSSYWERLQLHSKNLKQGGQKTGLDTLFEYFDFENANFGQAVEWLEKLVIWIRFAGGGEHHPHTRIRFLLLLLESNLEWKLKSSMMLQRILLQSYFFRLFTDTGVPSGNAFSKEFMLRLVSIFFPHRGKVYSMRVTLGTVFHEIEDPEWLANLPEGLQVSLFEWVSFYKDQGFSKKFPAQVLLELQEAIRVLCIRCISVAYREDLMERAAEDSKFSSSYFELFKLIDVYIKERDIDKKRILYKDILPVFEKCQHYIKSIQRHLEDFGVSLEIVFQLERITLFLSRVELLLKVEYSICEDNKERLQPVVWKFFVIILDGIQRDNGVKYWIRENLKLLSQKIVEHTGRIGEDTITRNKKEYWAMFWAAGGGGALTAFTALIKLYSPKDIPPFIDALISTVNYSVSFTLMHYLHFKLATKQPSVMASALAQKIKDTPESDLDLGFSKEVACISRSQFAAVAGNILMVIPMALLLHFIILFLTGDPSIKAVKAQSFLASIEPLSTLTLFYAAWTGVLLLVSSIFSGWIENAYVFYRIPEALRAQRFLKLFFGSEKLKKIVDHISEHLIGVSSSICLGTLLAFTPNISAFFGFPLDVRHVTLTAGSVVYSLSSIGVESVTWMQWVSAISSVAWIGLLNFGVSFWLALSIATRARDLPKQRIKKLFKSVSFRFIRSPLDFLFPVKHTSIQ